MKKNRRKKKKSDHGTPQVSNDPMAKAQITFVSFNKHLKPEASEAAEPLGLPILRDADVIIADDGKGNRAPFYGTEWLQEVANGKIDETVQKKMVFVILEAGEFDQQAEELRKIVEELKGSCCYGGDAVGMNDDEAKPRFMFMRDGYIQLAEVGNNHGMVLARTREMAQQYVAWINKKNGSKISIAEIGTVPGETLEGQLALSLMQGANCALVIHVIKGDTVGYDVVQPPVNPPQAT